MSLEGNTRAYSLGDLFQFILSNRYWGTLIFKNNEREYYLYFSKNNLIIPLERSWFRDPELLSRTGLTDPKTLAHARYFEEVAGASPLGILLYTSMVNRGKARSTLLGYVREECYHLFRLEGDYGFYKDEFIDYQDEDFSQDIAFPIQQFVTEVLRRSTERKLIQKDLSNDIYVVVVPPESLPEKQQKLLQYLRGVQDLDSLARQYHLDDLVLYGTVQQLVQKGMVRSLQGPEYLQQLQNLLKGRDYGKAFGLYFHSLNKKETSEVMDKMGALLWGDKTLRSLRLEESLQGPHKISREMTGASLSLFVSQALQNRFPLKLKVSRFSPQKKELFFHFEEKGFSFYEGEEESTEPILSYLVGRGILGEDGKQEWLSGKIQPQNFFEELARAGLVSKKDLSSFTEDRFLDRLAHLYYEKDLFVEAFPQNWPGDLENFWGVRYGFTSSIKSLADKFSGLLSLLQRGPGEDEILLLSKQAASRPSPDAGLREFISNFGKAPRPFKEILATFYPRYEIKDFLSYLLLNMDNGNIGRATLEETRQFLQLHYHMKSLPDLRKFSDSAEAMGYSTSDNYCKKRKEETDFLWNFEKSDSPMIRGALEEFSLSDILRTLVSMGKTGTLGIEGGESGANQQNRELYFLKGDLYVMREEALETRKETRSLFLATQAVQAIDDTFGETLVESGLVTEEEMSEELAYQVKEEIYELLFQVDASFCFRRNALPMKFIFPPNTIKKFKLKTDEFLEEASRRIAEWHEMMKTIQTEKALFQFTSPENQQRALMSGLSPQVLYLIDGTRSVENIIRISKQRRYDVYRILMTLLQGNYIAPVPSRRVFELAQEAKSRGDMDTAKSYHTYLLKILPDDPMVIELTKKLFLE